MIMNNDKKAMNRLTSYDADGELIVYEEERLLRSNGVIKNDEMYKIMRHLAERVAYYEDLQEQNKNLVLPCAVGDEVWYIDTYEGTYNAEIVRGVVDGYLWYRTCGFALDVVFDKPIMGHFAYKRKEMPFSEIGKSVFLTKEQATAAFSEVR